MSEINTSARIASIDTLRGITILAMLFVNDIAGVEGTPAWLKHISPSNADGMTIVDVVFPAFLFIVGLSIPFALSKRLDRGKNLGPIWKHIFLRTFSLLLIGVYMVNTETISTRGFLNPYLWATLMYIAVIFLWNSTATQAAQNKKLILVVKFIGAVLLVTLALLYSGNGATGLIQMRTQWWGILGLIGWAYLVGCAAYLPLRRNLPAMIGILALLYCIYMASEAGFFSGLTWISSWIDVGATLGSHGAVVVSGVVLGMMLHGKSAAITHRQRIRWAFLYGIGLAAAAILLHSLHDIHRMFSINKIMATIPWALWCSAITTWVWLIVYWLLDVKGWQAWAKVVLPAGRNALFAYILAPLFYSVFALLAVFTDGHDFYSQLGSGFSMGLWRSLIFAFSMTWLAGGLSRLGFRLKL